MKLQLQLIIQHGVVWGGQHRVTFTPATPLCKPIIHKTPLQNKSTDTLPVIMEYCRHLPAGDPIFQKNQMLTTLAV